MLPRLEHRAVPIVLAAVMIDVIGFGIIMPVLPQLVTELGGLSFESAARVAGWMLAVFAVAQFFAGPVMGNIADRFGRRPVLIIAMLAFGIDYLLMAVAPTLAWLFVGRAIAEAVLAGKQGGVASRGEDLGAMDEPPPEQALAEA